MNIFVTGATGFLGQHLVKALSEKNYNLRILVRDESKLKGLEGVHFQPIWGDVTDIKSMKSAMKDVNLVYHLAGVVGYSESQRKLMENVNVKGTENILNLSIDHSVKRFVHLSSVVAVGASSDKTILNEESEYNVEKHNWGYFETKRAAEKLVLNAAKENKINALCLNPSTIYGPGDMQKGSRKVQLKVAKGKFLFYPPGGVSIIDVEDVVDCLIKAIDTGQSGERYILSGENITIKKLFQIIANISNVPQPAIPLPKVALKALGKLGDQLQRMGKNTSLSSENAQISCMYHWFDNTKAKKTFNLKPKPAFKAIERSLRWARLNGLLK